MLVLLMAAPDLRERPLATNQIGLEQLAGGADLLTMSTDQCAVL